MMKSSKSKKITWRLPKVQRFMLVVFLTLAILPILAFGGYTIYRTQRDMDSHDTTQIQAETTRVNSSLFGLTLSVYTETDAMIAQDMSVSIFGSSSADADPANTDFLENSLKNYEASTAYVSDIRIYTDNPNVTQKLHISYTESPDACDWYQDLDGHWGTWCYIKGNSRAGSPQLALVKRLPTGNQDYSAWLIVWIDPNYLRNIIGETDYQIQAMVSDGTVFYSSDRHQENRVLTIPDGLDMNGSNFTRSEGSGKNTLLVSYRTLIPYQTTGSLYIRIVNTHAYADLYRNIVTLIIIILFSIVLPTILYYLYSRMFSRRVESLREAMHQVRTGNYEIVDQLQGNDELSETFEDLKGTVENIHAKDEEYYQAILREKELESEQQKMEYKMMASQINPHFLYNTLEMIRMQALAGGNRDVAKSIKLLGNIMHYVLSSTGTGYTTLTKELKYVTDYLEIQRLRFGDRVNYTVDIDEGIDADQTRILPLLIQPIAENAISHGLEGIEHDGLITISVSRDEEEDTLSICTADNGVGMTQEELEALRERIRSHTADDVSHIGLYNINRRIKLMYGEPYGLTIDSVPGRGTVVTIILPGGNSTDE